MTIGERIKARRLEIGMSVDQLAEAIGKNRATVYRYESNDIEKYTVDVLYPLASALRTTPAYLMGWSECKADTHAETGVLTSEEVEMARKAVYFTCQTDEKMDSGVFLKLLLQELGLTYPSFCSMFGLNEREIDNWINSYILPSPATVDKVAAALHIDKYDLLSDEEFWASRGIVRMKNEETQEGLAGDINIIRIAGRDGTLILRKLTDDQMAAIKAVLNAMPDASKDL